MRFHFLIYIFSIQLQFYSQENFPPYIYYKVFTCRNIADIGAFAPRDYTNAVTKQLPMKFIHNKGIELNGKLLEFDFV